MSDRQMRSLNWDEENVEEPSVKSRNNYLLAIGIDQYQHCAKLENAVRDAEDFVDLMLSDFQFEKAHLTTLYNEQATEKAIPRTLRAYAEKLTADDNLLVFFPGMGILMRAKMKRFGYLLMREYGILEDYIPYSRLMKIINSIPSHHTLFIVDSCYSGASFVATRDASTSLKRFEKDPSRWMLASGRNEVVPDGAIGENSPFTEQLISTLKRFSGSGIKVSTLVDKVTTATIHNSKQTPIGRPLYGVGDQGGEFVFHPRKNESADWVETMKAQTAAQFLAFYEKYPKGTHSDEALWNWAQLKNKKGSYRSYLNSFPKGQYRESALNHLDTFEMQQAWAKAQKEGKEVGLRRFLHDYPHSPFKQEAEQMIADIIAKEQSGPVSGAINPAPKGLFSSPNAPINTPTESTRRRIRIKKSSSTESTSPETGHRSRRENVLNKSQSESNWPASLSRWGTFSSGFYLIIGLSVLLMEYESLELETIVGGIMLILAGATYFIKSLRPGAAYTQFALALLVLLAVVFTVDEDYWENIIIGMMLFIPPLIFFIQYMKFQRQRN